jgi:hypothetical protein
LRRNFKEGEDKFKGVWSKVDGNILLRYGQEIGLGNMDYELIKI